MGVCALDGETHYSANLGFPYFNFLGGTREKNILYIKQCWTLLNWQTWWEYRPLCDWYGDIRSQPQIDIISQFLTALPHMIHMTSYVTWNWHNFSIHMTSYSTSCLTTSLNRLYVFVIIIIKKQNWKHYEDHQKQDIFIVRVVCELGTKAKDLSGKNMLMT